MIALRLAILWAACLTAVLADTRQLQPPTTYASENWEYRLSTIIKPINYNITLRPYLLESDGQKRFTFDGEVFIEIQPSVATKLISLHSRNLTHSIREYWVKPAAGAKPTPLPLALQSHNQETDIMNLTSTADLAANQFYILHFKYTGIMQDDMAGFYRSYYVNDNNETKWVWLFYSNYDPYLTKWLSQMARIHTVPDEQCPPCIPQLRWAPIQGYLRRDN